MMPGSKEKGRFGLQGTERRHIPLASQAAMYTNCHCCTTQHYAQPTTIMHPKTANYLMETYQASPGSSVPVTQTIRALLKVYLLELLSLH